jgi:Fe-S-cluster containining protein
MGFLSETKALARLAEVRDRLRTEIRGRYEHKAKNCDSCETRGACCLDVHFVNVRITRLEARGIRRTIDALPVEERDRIYSRIDETIERFRLDAKGEALQKMFACPLYESETGCLVHKTAKPLPCITHACYENKADLPPEELLSEAEEKAAALNQKSYGRGAWSLPIPTAIKRAG